MWSQIATSSSVSTALRLPSANNVLAVEQRTESTTSMECIYWSQCFKAIQIPKQDVAESLQVILTVWNRRRCSRLAGLNSHKLPSTLSYDSYQTWWMNFQLMSVRWCYDSYRTIRWARSLTRVIQELGHYSSVIIMFPALIFQWRILANHALGDELFVHQRSRKKECTMQHVVEDLHEFL